MQKTLFLALVGYATLTSAVETSSLRTKLKGLAQLAAKNNNATDCDLQAPELGDLSGDLLDWCPDTFGASESNLGAALTTAAS